MGTDTAHVMSYSLTPLSLSSRPQGLGSEGPNNRRFSYLAQKRRSSLSELTAFFQDLVDDGESSRMIANMPIWSPGTSDGGFPPREGNGTGSRVTFKRTAPEDFETYGEYGMDGGGSGRSSSGGGGGASSSSPAADGGSNGGAGSGPGWTNPQLKRARGGPDFQEPLPSGREGEGDDADRCRRMSERTSARVASRNPMVVQAVTCLASALPESGDDSEDNAGEDARAPATGEEGPLSPLVPPIVVGGGVKREEEELAHTISDESFNREEAARAARDMSRLMPAPPARRRSTINDIMATCSTEQAMEQVREGGGGGSRGGGGGDEEGEEKKVQRASVYLLMHAMAAVDAANDDDDEGYGGEEPLDDVEKYAEAAI